MRRYRYTRPCSRCDRTAWVRKVHGQDAYTCAPCDGAPIDRLARRGRDARRVIRACDRTRTSAQRALQRADMRRKRMTQASGRTNGLWRRIADTCDYIDELAA